MSWKTSEMLMDTIKHYASFPATGVSLRQMVQFGERPSTGTTVLPEAVGWILAGREGLTGWKERSFGRRNSCQRSFQFAWRTGSRSSIAYRMA